MSTTVKYKGTTIATISNTTKTLQTQGKYCEDNIEITDSGGGGGASLTHGSKSVTPSETAYSGTEYPPTGYDGFDQFTVSVGAISSTYVGSGVSRQAAQTIHPSTSDQTIAADKYLTGAQTVKGVLLTNLLASVIKKDEVVKIGDSTDDDCVASVTGTYEAGGGITAATGEITLASDFSLTTSAQPIPNLQLSFQPDFFYIVMNRASFTSAARSAGLYGLIAVKRTWFPPIASSTTVTQEASSGDYSFFEYHNVYNNTNISTGYGLGNASMVSPSYYSRFKVNADGTISVGRYSSASTKMFAGTYRYFAVKLP